MLLKLRLAYISISLRSILMLSSHLRLCLPSAVFPSSFRTILFKKTLWICQLVCRPNWLNKITLNTTCLKGCEPVLSWLHIVSVRHLTSLLSSCLIFCILLDLKTSRCPSVDITLLTMHTVRKLEMGVKLLLYIQLKVVMINKIS